MLVNNRVHTIVLDTTEEICRNRYIWDGKGVGRDGRWVETRRTPREVFLQVNSSISASGYQAGRGAHEVWIVSTCRDLVGEMQPAFIGIYVVLCFRLTTGVSECCCGGTAGLGHIPFS